MTSEPGFWDRLGLDEAGMPKHLPMGVTAEGQGPTNDAEAHHFVCWCGLSDCPLTKALAQAHQQAAVEGWEVVGAHDDLAAWRDEVAGVLCVADDCINCEGTGQEVAAWTSEGHVAEFRTCSRGARMAQALMPLIERREAEARAGALADAAKAWQQGQWSDVLLPKPTPPAVPVIAYANRVGDWLRDRADSIAPEVTE